MVPLYTEVSWVYRRGWNREVPLYTDVFSILEVRIEGFLCIQVQQYWSHVRFEMLFY